MQILNSKKAPCLTRASVFQAPFFHPDLFIAPSPNLFSSKSSHLSVLRQRTHFPHFNPGVPALDKALYLCQDIIFLFAPGNISSSCWPDPSPAVGAWFSCRALWVCIQPNFPSWCHFTLAVWAARGKEKGKTQLAKTQLRNANGLRWNPPGGRCTKSPHIFNQSGQIEGCRRESAAEIGSRPKL